MIDISILLDIRDGLLEPFLSPSSRMFWPGLLPFALVLCISSYKRQLFRLQSIRSLFQNSSLQLDLSLFVANRILQMLFPVSVLGGTWWLSTKMLIFWSSFLGASPAWSLGRFWYTVIYSLTLFLVWDFSRFILHWFVHKIPQLWAFHQVHHSATKLSPLTFFRTHPVETFLFQSRSIVSTSLVVSLFSWLFQSEGRTLELLGVPAIGFILNMAFGNFRHSQLWIRYPGGLERWFISPAQHQLHHSAEPKHYDCNFGTWLSIWDRMFGTLQLAEKRPKSFGIKEANHTMNLASAWFGPFRSLLPLIALFLSPLAMAEEDDDEYEDANGEIIVYGENEQVKEAGSAHQVPEAILELFEWDDIEKIVLTIPGVSTRGEDGFGLRPNIGIRGANSDRSAKITLMEDGILLSPAPYGAPAAYYFPLSTRLTGVEVFKGASSTRYGPQTVGGALNVLTREIPDKKQVKIDLSAGLRNSYKAHAFAGKGNGSSGYLLEAVRLQSDGFKELPSGSNTGFSRNEVMFKMAKASKNQRVQLKLGVSNEQSNETYLGLTEADWAENPWQRYAASEMGLMEWTRTQAHLEWKRASKRDWFWRTVAYHHYLDRSWLKLNGFQGGIDPHQLLIQDPQSGQGAVYLSILRGEESSTSREQNLLIGSNDRSFQNFGVQTVSKKEVFGDAWSNKIELGARLHVDQVDRVHTEQSYAMIDGALEQDTQPLQTTLDGHSQAAALATYFYDDFQWNKWHLFPSARLEMIQSFEDKDGERSDTILRSTFLPGMGLLFDISDWTHFFASSHKGFSPVSPGQPKEVQAEESWNYELGVRSQQDFATVELIGFFNDYSNITGQCSFSSGCTSADIGSQHNGGEAWIYGAESVAGYDVLLPRSLEVPLRVTYAYTESKFQSAFTSSFPQFGSVSVGDSLPYVAKHQTNMSIGMSAEVWKISSNWQYRSGMLDQAGQFGEGELEIEPLWMWDLAGEWHLRKDWALACSGSNLLNKTTIVSWRPYGARPVAPRQVFLSLSFQQ